MFENKSPKQTAEMTPGDIESLLEVKIDPAEVTAYVLEYAKIGGRISFLINPNYNLYLSTRIHDELAIRLGVIREECLIGDGSFKIIPPENNVQFWYTYRTNKIGKKVDLCEAAENKIKQFLRSKEIEVKL